MTASAATFKVAVVTPYYQEPLEVLRACHESVLAQTYPCTHFLVSDGSPHMAVRDWAAEQIVFPTPHGDNGNTPRGAGSLSAMNQDFDAIAYLDADNWYRPSHIAAMVALHRQSGAPICTATRTVHRADGSLMFTDEECDGQSHVDTSCLFLTREAFRILPYWATMPRQFGPICDRAIWQIILAHDISSAHYGQPTVAFRTQYEFHYRKIGETPPPGSKSNEDSTGSSWSWWDALEPAVRESWKRYFSGEGPLGKG
jgi:glycosyltransferase involved in cell wall biosynthesis